MKKIFRWIWSLLEVIIIIYVILITSFILCKNKYGYTQFGDYTLSNVTLLDERNIQNTKKGDLLIIKNSNDIKVGDLMYYYAAYNDTYIIKSDVVRNVEEDDYSALYTVGNEEDPDTIAGARVLGKYANTYHSIGGVISVIESRLGFLFLVLLPIMVVFIYQVYEFVIILRYEKTEEIEDNSKEDNKTKKSLKDEESKDKKSEEDEEIL